SFATSGAGVAAAGVRSVLSLSFVIPDFRGTGHPPLRLASNRRPATTLLLRRFSFHERVPGGAVHGNLELHAEAGGRKYFHSRPLLYILPVVVGFAGPGPGISAYRPLRRFVMSLAVESLIDIHVLLRVIAHDGHFFAVAPKLRRHFEIRMAHHEEIAIHPF